LNNKQKVRQILEENHQLQYQLSQIKNQLLNK